MLIIIIYIFIGAFFSSANLYPIEKSGFFRYVRMSLKLHTTLGSFFVNLFITNNNDNNNIATTTTQLQQQKENHNNINHEAKE